MARNENISGRTSRGKVASENNVVITVDEPKKRHFTAFIIILIIIGIFVALYFYTDIFKREEKVIEVVHIGSISGTVISVESENDTFVLEVEVTLRHDNGVPVIEKQTRIIMFSDTTRAIDRSSDEEVIKDDFFDRVEVGDVVYISGGNILNVAALEPNLIILHPGDE